MDIKDRVMGDQPDSFLHKIASKVPGYTGYVDRERRRDADKLLRMQLAREYTSQRDRLNRAQQGLLRAKQLKSIGEVDRLVGVLQRFIDRLSTATYGYTGLFDPVKVEAQDLDQLYAFDMALAGGVDQVSAAIDSIESADPDELHISMSRLATILNDLNKRLDERANLLTSGRRLPEGDYHSLMGSLNQMATQTSVPSQKPEVAGQRSGTGGQSYGSSSGDVSGGEKARVSGSTGMNTDAGIPTSNLNMSSTMPPGPGMSQIVEGNTGFSEMPEGGGMGMNQQGPMPLSDTAGSGIESASSPSSAPGAPGHDIVDGLGMANKLGTPLDNTGGTKPPGQ